MQQYGQISNALRYMKEARFKKLHIVQFHLYGVLEKKIIGEEIKSIVARYWGKQLQKGMCDLESDKIIQYLDCGDGYRTTYIC